LVESLQAFFKGSSKKMAASFNQTDHRLLFLLMMTQHIPSDPQAEHLYKKAMDVYKKGDQIAALKKLKDCWQVAKTSNDQLWVANMISYLSYEEHMDDTFQWMRLTENLFKDQTDPENFAQLGNFLNFYGETMVEWDGNPEETLRVLYKSRRFLAFIIDQDEQNRSFLANHNQTALTYQKLNQHHLVIHHWTKCLSLYHQGITEEVAHPLLVDTSYQSINTFKLDVLNSLGDSYMHLGHYEQAYECFKTGHDMETFLNNDCKENVLSKFYGKISNTLMKLGKYRQAYKYHGAILKTRKHIIKDYYRQNDYHVLSQLYAPVAYCQMHCGMYEIADKNFHKVLKHIQGNPFKKIDDNDAGAVDKDDILDAILHCRKKRGDFQYVFSHQESFYNTVKKNSLVDFGEKTIRLSTAYIYTGKSGWYNCLMALFCTIKRANCLDESIRIICKCLHDYKDPEDLSIFQVLMNQFLVMETLNPKLEAGVIPDNFQTEFNTVCNAVRISKHLVASAKRHRALLFVLDVTS
jgi:tetratricopeptide (TPR) repeat protein